MDCLICAISFVGDTDTPVTTLAQRVDLVELNHHYDDSGTREFDQLIFYQWDPHRERYAIKAWRLVKSRYQVPVRRWTSGDWVVVWNDGQLNRTVYADQFTETWTQYDPESREKRYLPKDKRTELVQLPDRHD